MVGEGKTKRTGQFVAEILTFIPLFINKPQTYIF
jgi:hypothetical protein